MEDCIGPNTVEQCLPSEACVVFKRLYKKGSGEFSPGTFAIDQRPLTKQFFNPFEQQLVICSKYILNYFVRAKATIYLTAYWR